MNEKGIRRANFELIQGGLHRETEYGPVRIIAAPEGMPPFQADAMVFEEDTWLVMSASPATCEPDVHPIRLMTDVMNAEPEPVGSVVVKKGNPLRFLAIVHDVNHEPTWTETWIEAALRHVFQEAEQRKISSMGLPLLGTKHGRLDKIRFVVLLAGVLKRTAFCHLKRLWLIVPPRTGSQIIAALKAEID
jgi:hypothetical protein